MRSRFARISAISADVYFGKLPEEVAVPKQIRPAKFALCKPRSRRQSANLCPSTWQEAYIELWQVNLVLDKGGQVPPHYDTVGRMPFHLSIPIGKAGSVSKTNIETSEADCPIVSRNNEMLPQRVSL